MKDFFDTKINREKIKEDTPLDRMIEDCWLRLPSPISDPPSWASEIDDDEEWQKEMGATELWIECKYCGTWVKSVSSFCNNDCKRKWIECQEMLKAMKKREKTMKYLRGGSK